MSEETFVCVNCGIEMEGTRYREYLDNWKQPPLCQCRARVSSESCSLWRRKLEGRVEPQADRQPLPQAHRYCIQRDGTLLCGRTVVQPRTQPGRTTLIASITRDDGQHTTVVIAREVARAFCPAFRPALQVEHIDGDPANCRAENLRFVERPGFCRVCKPPLPVLDQEYIRATDRSESWICRAFGLTPAEFKEIKNGRQDSP